MIHAIYFLATESRQYIYSVSQCAFNLHSGFKVKGSAADSMMTLALDIMNFSF